jgi:hypothetical protein
MDFTLCARIFSSLSTFRIRWPETRKIVEKLPKQHLPRTGISDTNLYFASSLAAEL